MAYGSSKKTVKKSAKAVGTLTAPSTAVAVGAMGSALGGRGAAAASALSGLFSKAERKAAKKEYKATKRKSRSPAKVAKGRLRRLAGRQDPAQRAKEDKIRVDITKRLRNKLGAQFTEAEARRVVEAAIRKERLRKQAR